MEFDATKVLHVWSDQQVESLIDKIAIRIMDLMEKEKLKESKYLTVKEVMLLLHRDRSTLTRWTQRGKVHPVKVGGKILWLREEVELLLNERGNI